MSEPSLDLRAKSAYDALAPLLAAIDPATTTHFTLYAVHAIAQARTTARNVEPSRARIASLPEFDVGHLDRLRQYADALHFVHTSLIAREDRLRAMPELAREGFPLRALLLAYAELLSIKGTLPAETVARLRDGSGYHDLVDDLSVLVLLYDQRPEVVGDGTPVTRAEVQRANELVQAMADALGLDKSELVTHDELAKNRQEIGHLLTTAQRQLRRAWPTSASTRATPRPSRPPSTPPRRAAARAPTPSPPWPRPPRRQPLHRRGLPDVAALRPRPRAEEGGGAMRRRSSMSRRLARRLGSL